MDSRKKILVVDDDRNMLRLLQAFLRDSYHVFACDNGRKALKIIEEQGPIDLVLLDYLMPDMDGYETLKLIKEDKTMSDTDVFFLTGVSETEKVDSVMELEPAGYILKPIGKLSLLAKINEYFESKQA